MGSLLPPFGIKFHITVCSYCNSEKRNKAALRKGVCVKWCVCVCVCVCVYVWCGVRVLFVCVCLCVCSVGGGVWDSEDRRLNCSPADQLVKE